VQGLAGRFAGWRFIDKRQEIVVLHFLVFLSETGHKLEPAGIL